MSAQEEDIPPPGLGPENLVAEDGIYTVSVWDDAMHVSDEPDVGRARTFLERRMASIAAEETPAVADVYGQVVDLLEKAWDDGELPYTETGDFLSFLRFRMGVPVITAGLIASGALAGYLLKYAEQHGYPPATEPTFAPTPHYGKPPAQETGPGPVTTFAPTPHYGKPPAEVVAPGPVTTPATPAPKPKPTHAQRAVAGAAKAITRQQVPSPGLTTAEADAISKAIGAATADVLRVQAAVIDALLPGMAPGQVPEALSQLNQAATVLEHQVHQLQRQVGHPANTALPGKVSGLGAAVTGLQATVAHLVDQMTGDTGSGLMVDLDAVRESAAASQLELAHIGKELPKLATTAALTALTAKVDVTVEELGLHHASALDNAVQGLRATITEIATKTEENADCCDEAHEVTDPIKSGGATPSLLKSLGSLLKTAVEGVFVAGIINTLLLIFDAPSVISTTVIDTETMSNWAISAANVIEQDLSWLGKVPGG